MSPRRTRAGEGSGRAGSRRSGRAPAAPAEDVRPAWLVDTVEVDGQEWAARPVTGAASTKAYRCPGCDHEIALGVPHVVAWPTGQTERRRHWHTPCWQRRRAGARPYRAPY